MGTLIYPWSWHTFSGSVGERAEDEETVLLLPYPLEQLVDRRHGLHLGHQRGQAQVELKAAGQLEEEGGGRTAFSSENQILDSYLKSDGGRA